MLVALQKVRAELAKESDTPEGQEKVFLRLGVSKEVIRQVQAWGAPRVKVERLLRYLKRLRYWWEASEERLELGRQAYGTGRDSHYQMRPATVGDVGRLDMAVANLRQAIDDAIAAHVACSAGVHDERIARALVPMMEVVRQLDAGEIEVDPSLPERVAHAKAKMILPLSNRDVPCRVKRRALLQQVREHLRDLHPALDRAEARSIASEILQAIIPIPTRR
jgi:hypothetical protein